MYNSLVDIVYNSLVDIVYNLLVDIVSNSPVDIVYNSLVDIVYSSPVATVYILLAVIPWPGVRMQDCTTITVHCTMHLTLYSFSLRLCSATIDLKAVHCTTLEALHYTTPHIRILHFSLISPALHSDVKVTVGPRCEKAVAKISKASHLHQSL